jgi:hypothetical protein
VLSLQLLPSLLRSLHRRAAGPDAERGDVPGWVLVTVMTAGLVAALWIFAEPLLTDVMQTAVDTVTGNL